MKPAPFAYHRAVSTADAVAALAGAGGEAKLLAGGQSLVPLLAMRLARPALLVDLGAIPGLAGVVEQDGRVTVGAMTRHRDLATQSGHPLAAEAAGWIGHAAIRTRGTIGGSLAHADPNAELPAVAVACDGVLHVEGGAGPRTVPAVDLFEGVFQTALRDDEVLTAVDLRTPGRWGFAELTRRHGDFALVLSVVAEIDGSWRVVLGGVASTPVRCAEAEAALDGTVPGAAGAEVADAAAAAVESGVRTYDDLHAGARYRLAMAAELTRRAVTSALVRGDGASS